MNTKTIPQQITLANLIWFNNMLLNGNKEKDISRRHGTFTSLIEELFVTYSDIIVANRDTMDTNNTLEILEFLEKVEDIKENDRNVISFSKNYFQKEICELDTIEENMTIDENVKTFKTVFNTRTLGYTKTFFKEIQKTAKTKTFQSELDIIKAVNLVIPHENIEDIKGIDKFLSDNTVDRRKTTLKYWQDLCEIAA